VIALTGFGMRRGLDRWLLPRLAIAYFLVASTFPLQWLTFRYGHQPTGWWLSVVGSIAIAAGATPSFSAFDSDALIQASPPTAARLRATGIVTVLGAVLLIGSIFMQYKPWFESESGSVWQASLHYAVLVTLLAVVVIALTGFGMRRGLDRWLLPRLAIAYFLVASTFPLQWLTFRYGHPPMEWWLSFVGSVAIAAGTTTLVIFWRPRRFSRLSYQ
jgi:uncharacterized membrane protein HdeD (DUF308 family)